jgi:hypothetical protein
MTVTFPGVVLLMTWVTRFTEHTFKDEEGRKGHINGEVAKALFARAEELFVTHRQIQTADILAEKLQER